MAYAQLRQRGVNVSATSRPRSWRSSSRPVERFEMAVSAVGGDRMTNAPDSTDPDDRRLVLPARDDGEGAGAYAGAGERGGRAHPAEGARPRCARPAAAAPATRR
jgi:hypothetical protein